jgi:hypothetical protein
MVMLSGSPFCQHLLIHSTNDVHKTFFSGEIDQSLAASGFPQPARPRASPVILTAKPTHRSTHMLTKENQPHSLTP